MGSDPRTEAAAPAELLEVSTPWGTLKTVLRDGPHIWKLRCPECGHWGDIDEDQLRGRVSLDHTNCGRDYPPSECDCAWHETHDYFKVWAVAERFAFLERLRQRVIEDRPLLKRLEDNRGE